MTLSKAIIDMLAASAVEAQKQSEYEGCARYYDGFDYIQSQEKAIENFIEELNNHISEQVSKIADSVREEQAFQRMEHGR